MKIEYITIDAGQRFDAVMPEIPTNSIINKTVTGCGATYAELKASDTNPFSTDVFALSLIERRNPLVKQAFEILGTERVRELKYNQTQIRRELIKCSADELAYKIVKRINADLPHGKAIPSKIIKERLQTIYDDLGVERRAKATDIVQ